MFERLLTELRRVNPAQRWALAWGAAGFVADVFVYPFWRHGDEPDKHLTLTFVRNASVFCAVVLVVVWLFSDGWMRRRKIPEDALRRIQWWTNATIVYLLLMFARHGHHAAMDRALGRAAGARRPRCADVHRGGHTGAGRGSERARKMRRPLAWLAAQTAIASRGCESGW